MPAISLSLRHSPRCIAGVCQCQITCTELIEHAQHTETGANRMAALDANQTGNLAGTMGLLDARRRRDQCHVMRIELNQATYQIDLFQRQLHCIQMLRRARSVGGPELGRDHALLEPTQIRVAPRTRRPRGQFAQIAAEMKVFQLILEEFAYVPRQIVVAIDQWHLLEHVAHTLHAIVEIAVASAAAAAAAGSAASVAAAAAAVAGGGIGRAF